MKRCRNQMMLFQAWRSFWNTADIDLDYVNNILQNLIESFIWFDSTVNHSTNKKVCTLMIPTALSIACAANQFYKYIQIEV